jgi:PAS domain S-box-containing protein
MLVKVRIRLKPLANLDKHHGKTPAFHRSGWLSVGRRGGRIRRNLSLRAQLSLLVGALVLVAIGSLGPIAYNTSRSIIESGAVREVGITANARKQELIRLLTDQRVRAAALLKTASLGCAPDEIRCLRRVLADFLRTEGASAVELVYRGRPPIIVGGIGAPIVDAGVPAHSELARFDWDGQKRPYYVITLRAVTRDGETVITLWGDMQVVSQIFRDRYGLGRSGDTFLVDSNGFFLTPPRDSLPAGVRQPIGGKAIQSCLAGSDSEVLDQDYRGVPVIYGFRYVPEIGGGCITALIEQSEAFAPTNRLRKQVANISVLLAILAIGCSVLFAQLIARPIKRLSQRASALQAGDFDSPVPVSGPAEVQTFGRTFESMARSLRDSRTALEASNEQVRNMLESISDAFIAFDREWRCTYANEKATMLIRVRREHLLGKSLWELLPDLVSRTGTAELRRGMESRQPVHFEEYHAPFDAWFEVDGYPTRDGFEVFGRDITERKRISERLQQTQKLESLGVLAGGIAHDFNNLLTGILGNASLGSEELPPHHPARDSFEGVIRAGERASVLTRQLLAYAGKGRFVIQPLDLNDLVREISSLLQASIPRTVKLCLQLQERLPAIEADAAQIQQLIMNLVINGAEAIEADKTGTVLITTSLHDVDQSYMRQILAPSEISPGKYISLEVHDDGCGMDEATLRRVFDPFFTTKFAGRGLGLAAAMGIVRGHKGTLKVYSSPGKGSIFKILLPASHETVTARQQAGSESRYVGAGTILVIDDEDIVRQTAKSILESYGYSVVIAENGHEGVEFFRQLGNTILLVLLDMTMPDMPGEEALENLWRIKPDVPVILSSGFTEAEARKHFAGKRLAGFVQKPYTAPQLTQQLRIALSVAPDIY